jgi:uncharacterized pyridoxamine 5'-phosphate oxidase family protein
MKNIEDAYEFLKEAGVFFLATAEGSQPHVRPFGALDFNQGRIYIQTGHKKAVSQQMRLNPHVEICAYRQGRWLRITAEAILDSSLAAQEHLLQANPDLKGLGYRAGDGNTEVYYLARGQAVFSSFTQAPETVRF